MLRGLQTRPLDLPLTDICIRPRFATTPLKLIKLRDFHSEILQNDLVSQRNLSFVNASSLERGLPGFHRVDHHADGLNDDRSVVDHDVVSRVADRPF